MSQENVERVYRAMDAFNRRDLDAFLALADPSVEFTPYVVGLEGSYHGHDGVGQWWRDLFGVFPDWRGEPVDVRDLGDWTLTTLRIGGHGDESGTPVTRLFWQLAKWSTDGKIVQVTHYGDEAQALEAAGLSE
jgi:ketosteroid isomerase-like protein